MASRRRLIFLTGAPTTHGLSWDEDQLIGSAIAPFDGVQLTDFQGFHRFPEAQTARWRILRDHKDFTAEDDEVPGSSEPKPLFMTRMCNAADGETTCNASDTGASEFYDHSFNVHENSEISLSENLSEDAHHGSGSWTVSNEDFRAAHANLASATSMPAVPDRLTDLKDIPSARHLQSIIPQTMTVDLIVGILAVRPPRRIVTRQWKRELDVVELVVADETRSGFGITLWLQPPPPTAHANTAENAFREIVAGMRPRDVVSFRNVGLSVFQERVYGQSLRSGVTKVDLLYRQPVDATDAGGMYTTRMINHAAKPAHDQPSTIIVKVRAVRDWLRAFVATPTDGVGGEKGIFRPVASLPPDTQ